MALTSKLPEIIAGIEAAVKEAEVAGAELVAQTARERVPFDPATPHHVRDAIHIEETEDGLLVVAGDKEAWWAHMIEHGTTHSPPQPFLVPALEENRAKIEDGIRAAVRKATP